MVAVTVPLAAGQRRVRKVLTTNSRGVLTLWLLAPVPRIEGEAPGANEVGDIGVGGSGDDQIAAGSEGFEFMLRAHKLHGPACPGLGDGNDIVLIVTVVDAEREQFEQFASVILISDVLAVSFAADSVEIDDHGGALGADS